MEGVLEEFPLTESVDWELRFIKGQIKFLEDIIYGIVDDFNYISWITDGIKFTIQDLQRTFKDLEKDFARRQAELLALGDAYVNFGYHIERLTAQRDNIA